MSDASAGSNLVRRVLSACVFVPAVLGLSYAGDWALFALVAAIVETETSDFED